MGNHQRSPVLWGLKGVLDSYWIKFTFFLQCPLHSRTKASRKNSVSSSTERNGMTWPSYVRWCVWLSSLTTSSLIKFYGLLVQTYKNQNLKKNPKVSLVTFFRHLDLFFYWSVTLFKVSNKCATTLEIQSLCLSHFIFSGALSSSSIEFSRRSRRFYLVDESMGGGCRPNTKQSSFMY